MTLFMPDFRATGSTGGLGGDVESSIIKQASTGRRKVTRLSRWLSLGKQS